jgi:signal peptidase I
MRKGKKLISALLDFCEILFISCAVFVVVYAFVGQLIQVDGMSMYRIFLNNDRIISEKLSLNYKALARGEVVIFFDPRNPNGILIKRVIGLPNETLKISAGKIHINDNVLEESYLPDDISTVGGAVITEDLNYQIPDKSYVLLGDNREASTDSRDFGAVSEKYVTGRPVVLFYPLNRFKVLQH